MSGLVELRDLHRTLGTLLADPSPDNVGWRLALRNTLLNMACYAGDGTSPRYAGELLQSTRLMLELWDAAGSSHTAEECHDFVVNHFDEANAAREALAKAVRPTHTEGS